jgi:hypothetical protein
MTKLTIFKVLIGNILVIAGIVWSIMFPKTTDYLKPDFIASVAIGAGFILSGIVIMFLKKNRIVSVMLAILLIWSLALNVFMLSYAKCLIKASREINKDRSISVSQDSISEPDTQGNNYQ